MKKLFLMSLCLMMSLSLVACEKKVDLENESQYVSEEVTLTENKLTDTCYGITFEMVFPKECDDTFKLVKTIEENKTTYSGYDLVNESDGGYLFTLYVTNDYPYIDGVSNKEAYEESYTAAGESKILYTNEENKIMCSFSTASDVPCDVTSEEKRNHYFDMLQAIKTNVETFVVVNE